MNTAQNIVSTITNIGDDGHALFDRDNLDADLTPADMVNLADMALEARREMVSGLSKGIFTRYLNAIRTQPEVAAEVAELLAAHKAAVVAQDDN